MVKIKFKFKVKMPADLRSTQGSFSALKMMISPNVLMWWKGKELYQNFYKDTSSIHEG